MVVWDAWLQLGRSRLGLSGCSKMPGGTAYTVGCFPCLDLWGAGWTSWGPAGLVCPSNCVHGLILPLSLPSLYLMAASSSFYKTREGLPCPACRDWCRKDAGWGCPRPPATWVFRAQGLRDSTHWKTFRLHAWPTGCYLAPLGSTKSSWTLYHRTTSFKILMCAVTL